MQRRVDKDQERLFTTYRKKDHAVSVDALRRWIKEIFAETNLIENFTPHGRRFASTTKVFNVNLYIVNIFRKPCWSNAETFFSNIIKMKSFFTKE